MKISLGIVAVAFILTSSQALADGTHKHEHHHHADMLGAPGNIKNVSRTVDVQMSDTMRFTPSTITAKRGETIRFIVKNTGKLKHEMVLGSITALKEHAALMIKFPQMQHDDPNQVAVTPGKSGEIIWHFTNAGSVDFACLQPGHFEAGMQGKVEVK